MKSYYIGNLRIRKVRKLSFLTFLTILLTFLAFQVHSVQAATTFTGDAPADFTNPYVSTIDDPVGDVGMPVQLAGFVSGWDVDAVYVEYDYSLDMLFVGIDCFGICGDADGDGDPANTSAGLALAGGNDFADLGSSEAFIFLIDTNNDFNGTTGFDVVVGVDSDGGDITDFGIFNFIHNTTPWSSAANFGTALSNVTSIYANPSAADPDIEFTIADFSTLPQFTFTPGEAFSFGVYYFNGSLEDDGVGEDSVPGSSSSQTLSMPGYASIGNYVWLDEDMDGVQDADETTGIANVTVQLYDSSNNLIATTTTDASGYYSFNLVPPGDYYLVFSDIPSEYQISPQDAGGDNALDSDVDAGTMRTVSTTLSLGENDVSWDLGLYNGTSQQAEESDEVLAATGLDMEIFILVGILLISASYLLIQKENILDI